MHICMANMRVAPFPSTGSEGSYAPSCDGQLLKATYPPFDAFSRPFGGGRKDLETEPQKLGLSFCAPPFACGGTARYLSLYTPTKDLRAMAKSAPKTLVRQDFRRPRRRPPAGRHLHPLYRPPSRARGDEPAGVRGAAHRQAQGARAGEDAGGGGSQYRDHSRPHCRASRTRRAASRSRRSPAMPRISASNTTTSATSGRASCT